MFLDHDSARKTFTRHFFIPFQLHGVTGQLQILVTSQGAVALAVGDELAVFHNGLSFEEEIGFGGASLVSAKPSMRSKFERFSSAPS